MNYRDIQSGSVAQAWGSFTAQSLPEPITLSITTKCPEKWLLIDRETNQVYQGSSELNPFMDGQYLWKPVNNVS